MGCPMGRMPSRKLNLYFFSIGSANYSYSPCMCVCEIKLYIGQKNHFGITKDSIFWKVGIEEIHIEELSNMVETVFVFKHCCKKSPQTW